MAQKICRPPRSERHICAACTANIKITYAFHPSFIFWCMTAPQVHTRPFSWHGSTRVLAFPSHCYALLLQPVSLILSLRLFDLRKKEVEASAFVCYPCLIGSLTTCLLHLQWLDGTARGSLWRRASLKRWKTTCTFRSIIEIQQTFKSDCSTQTAARSRGGGESDLRIWFLRSGKMSFRFGMRH